MIIINKTKLIIIIVTCSACSGGLFNASLSVLALSLHQRSKHTLRIWARKNARKEVTEPTVVGKARCKSVSCEQLSHLMDPRELIKVTVFL